MLKSTKLLLPLAGGILLSAYGLYRFLKTNKDIPQQPENQPQAEEQKNEQQEQQQEEEKKIFDSDVQSQEQKLEENTKKILLIGSGMMTPCLIEYLTRFPQNRITIASNLIDQARKLQNWRKDQCKAIFLDVANEKDKLLQLVSNHNIAVSFVPAFLHIHVAKACLTKQIPFVTASYISPDLAALNSEFVNAKTLCMNQVGVDPGIDIMSTIKVVDEVHENGGKIQSYQSWCGGLPAPTSNDNPFGYKFSWTPRGALLSILNQARYLQNGEQKTIPGPVLLDHAKPMPQIVEGVNLQGYPNRNSFPFRDEYFKMTDTHTFLRGTLRYQGFSSIMGALVKCGFFSTQPDQQDFIHFKEKKFKQFINDSLLVEVEGYQQILADSDFRQIIEKNYNECSKDEESSKAIAKMIKKGFLDSSNKVALSRFVQAISFLKLMDDSCIVDPKAKSVLDALCAVMSPRMMIQDDDQDAIFMQHIFQIKDKNGVKKRIRSTMNQIGETKSSGGFSAMARCVGYPAAITIQIILEGKLDGYYGVRHPDFKTIYQPVLEQLEKEGIKLIEKEQLIQDQF